MSNLRRIYLISLVSLATLCSCDGSQSLRNEYVIGALYPKTGRAARYGEDSEEAAKMAVDEINSTGGINGRKLRLIVRDDEANVERARQLAREYILRDKVDFLMGVVSSSAALAVSALSKYYKTIFVGTDHSSSKLTYDNFQPYYFRVSNNTYQSMMAQALYAKEMNWRRYYVISPDYEYGHALLDDFRTAMKKIDAPFEIIGEAWPKLFEPDYTSYITAIKAAKPDVVAMNFWGGDTITFLRQARSLGLLDQTTILSCDAGGNYEVFEALGDELPEGVVLSARHHNNWPDTQANADFVRKFHQRAGRYPTYAAQGAYSGVYFIAAGLRSHPDVKDVDGLVKAMEQLELPCPEDPLGFVSRMDPLTHQLLQVQAVGITEGNNSFAPATRMLGKWKVYPAEMLVPSPEEVALLRQKTGRE